MVFDLFLRDTVGGSFFNNSYIQPILDEHKDRQVNILIQSLGGSAFEALAIYESFRRHGNVHVHYTGSNASAATLIGMGAKRITADKTSVWLVHKAGSVIDTYARMNDDEISGFIGTLSNEKDLLQKLDNIARSIYCARTGSDEQSMADLMKKEIWLTAEEAAEWKFIDSIEDLSPEDIRDQKATAEMYIDAGVKLPPGMRSTSLLGKIEEFITLFKPRKSMETANRPEEQAEETQAPVQAATDPVEETAAPSATLEEISRRLESIESKLSETRSESEPTMTVVETSSAPSDEYSSYMADLNAAREFARNF